MELPLNTVLLGDCLDRLKELPAESVDALITDCPYGLGTKEPNAAAIRAYLDGADLDHGRDFMNRDWQIPSIAVWTECFRVLRPGAHALVFGGTRTFDLISIGLRAAGFESRDTVASQFGVTALEWVYGQGFPKSLNIGKALEKAGVDPETAKPWEGWGTALKPSWEPILVFRKPIEETTVAKQVLKTGAGAMNIDACRVSTKDVINVTGETTLDGQPWSLSGAGRWPANIIFTHLDTCKVTGSPDEPVYECAEGCPVKTLDEQGVAAGVHPVGGKHPSVEVDDPWAAYIRSVGGDAADSLGWAGKSRHHDYHQDTGGASRFFSQFEPDASFLYAPKVSKAERDRGLPKGTNKHPTMKSQALMRWLVKLVTRKGGVVLDPYCGSGSTCIAALSEGCSYLGIERDPEFYAVAVKRIAAVTGTQDVWAELAELESE